MSSVQNVITEKLQQKFNPLHLEVHNESDMHSVPPNSETHFKVVLVSELFVGMMKVKRHQAAYGELAQELEGPVHALALHLYSPEEWATTNQQSPESPVCASKR